MRREQKRGPRLLKSAGLTIVGAGAGALAAFLFDPDRGRSRRAKLRDQAAHKAHSATHDLGGRSRGFANRGRGVAAGARYRVTGRWVDDAVLHDRIRAELGRRLSHPHAVQVRTDDHVVTLTGDILADEEARTLRAVKHVPGVQEVHVQWTVHESAGDVPTLQGSGKHQPRQPN